MSEVAVAVWNSKTKKYVNVSWKRVMVRKSLDEICHYAEVEIPSSERDLFHKHGIFQVRLAPPNIHPAKSAEDRNPAIPQRIAGFYTCGSINYPFFTWGNSSSFNFKFCSIYTKTTNVIRFKNCLQHFIGSNKKSRG